MGRVAALIALAVVGFAALFGGDASRGTGFASVEGCIES